jgi:hypothetical protein
MTIADSFFTWPRGAMLYPAVLVPIGTVLFALSGVLISAPAPSLWLHLAGDLSTDLSIQVS